MAYSIVSSHYGLLSGTSQNLWKSQDESGFHHGRWLPLKMTNLTKNDNYYKILVELISVLITVNLFCEADIVILSTQTSNCSLVINIQ